MVVVVCPACHHGWNTSASGSVVRCGKCGCAVHLVAREFDSRRSPAQQEVNFVDNWGGFDRQGKTKKSKGFGLLSSWGGF